MLSLEITEDADKNWNKRLLEGKGSIQQTNEYGLSKNLVGGKPLFLKFLNNGGEIVGQLLGVKYGLSSQDGFKKILKKLRGNNQLFKWVYGPIIFDQSLSCEIIKSLLKFLKEEKFNIWGSEFPLQHTLFTTTNSFQLDKWGTFLINLHDGKENIWNKLDKHSAKKNIERANERNVVVRELTKSDLLTYYQMSQEYGKSHPSVTPSFLEEQWDILQPVGYSGFLAFENDVPVGAIRVSSFNGYINEFSIIRTKRDISAKLYAQDLLKWKIIEWGIEKKFHYYDLSGVNPHPTDEKEKGIFRYKQKWGGSFLEYNIIKN